MIKNNTGQFAILENREGGVAVLRITKRFSSRFMFEQLQEYSNGLDLSGSGYRKYSDLKGYKNVTVVETEDEVREHIQSQFLTP